MAPALSMYLIYPELFMPFPLRRLGVARMGTVGLRWFALSPSAEWREMRKEVVGVVG